MNSLNRLSDEELLTRLKALAREERDATARVIAHLALIDARRLYLPEGCSSMFTYCTQVLHFSERAAYARIEVARAVRRFPSILDRLAEGSLNLTSILLLALDPETPWWKSYRGGRSSRSTAPARRAPSRRNLCTE